MCNLKLIKHNKQICSSDQIIFTTCIVALILLLFVFSMLMTIDMGNGEFHENRWSKNKAYEMEICISLNYIRFSDDCKVQCS